MRSTVASGAYQMLADKKGIEIDLSNPDKQLVQEAMKLVRQSQGSSFFKDQPLALTTSFGLTGNVSLNKTILTFQSFMLSHWDNIVRQVWRLGIQEKNYKKAIMSFFWIVIVAAALEEGIRRSLKKGINTATSLVTGKPDDYDYGSYLDNSVFQFLQSIPIAGQLVTGMTYSSNPVPVVNTFDQMLSGMSGIWNGKALETKIKGGINLIGAAGSLFGVPGAGQTSQLIKGFVPNAKSSSKTNSSFPSLPTLPTLPKLPKLPKIN